MSWNSCLNIDTCQFDQYSSACKFSGLLIILVICSEKKKNHKLLYWNTLYFFQIVYIRAYIMYTQFDFFCHKCDTQNPLSHCENCYIYFCAVCSEKHRRQEYKEHIIVPFALRGSTFKCKIHLTAICEFSCEHLNHTIVDFLRAFTF